MKNNNVIIDDIWYITKMRVTLSSSFIKKHRIPYSVYFIERTKYNGTVTYSLTDLWGKHLKDNKKAMLIIDTIKEQFK